jgi:fido (protein-threonine AMPylation protein)
VALTDPHAPGATPLRPEELRGLKHSVTTHGELNELEAANIVQGQQWALSARTARVPGMLSDEFVQLLHKRMYGAVWTWAGKYREHDTNIGVTYIQIRTSLRVARGGYARVRTTTEVLSIAGGEYII